MFRPESSCRTCLKPLTTTLTRWLRRSRTASAISPPRRSFQIPGAAKSVHSQSGELLARTDFRHRRGVRDGLHESTDGQFWRQPAVELARQAPARHNEGCGEPCEFGSWVTHLQLECCNRLVVAEYGHRNGICSALEFASRYGHPYPANRGQVMPEPIRCGDGVSGELRKTLRDEPVGDERRQSAPFRRQWREPARRRLRRLHRRPSPPA